MTSSDALGDRMKLYEGYEAGRRLMPLLPAFARLDGRAFHTLTKSLARPFDAGFVELMQKTAEYLARETNAGLTYVASDEITLCWPNEVYGSETYFGGRVHKMVSILAAEATAHFNALRPTYLPSVTRTGLFDCRVWQVPNLDEAANVFVWREQDASRNSIQMLARSRFSHNECHLKDTSALHEMLHTVGVNWNDLPDVLKRGTYYARRVVRRRFDAAELARLPPKHEAHANPDLEIERHDVLELALPPITKVSNRVDVLFRGAVALSCAEVKP